MMKLNLNALICALFLAFVIGCGKDNSTGTNKTNVNLNNSNLSASSQQSLQKVINWYQGSQEGQGLTGVVNITKTKYESANSNCVQKTVLGISYQDCSSNQSQAQGFIVSQQPNVNLIQDGKTISSKGNQDLNALFSGADGTLISVVDVSSTASQLNFIRSDGVLVTYIIDTNYHSSLNPLKKTESSQTSKFDIIVTAQSAY
jgi:hypothetical protein